MVQFLRNCFCYALGFCLFAVQYAAVAAEELKAGIGIFDTLYIAGNSTLAVHGDIHLAYAHLLGEGSLVLKADGEATIASKQSEVNHLEISTKSKVTLAGDLTVNQSLKLNSGIFDISAGTLTLADSAAVQWQQGAQLLQHDQITSLPIRGTHQHTIEFSAKAILTSIELEYRRLVENTNQCYSELQTFPLLAYKDAAKEPPENEDAGC